MSDASLNGVLSISIEIGDRMHEFTKCEASAIGLGPLIRIPWARSDRPSASDVVMPAETQGSTRGIRRAVGPTQNCRHRYVREWALAHAQLAREEVIFPALDETKNRHNQFPGPPVAMGKQSTEKLVDKPYAHKHLHEEGPTQILPKLATCPSITIEIRTNTATAKKGIGCRESCLITRYRTK